MVLVDVNILIHAINRASPHQKRAQAWLEARLNGPDAVALPWVVLLGFIRLAINPKVMIQPLTLEEALAQMREWAGLPRVKIPIPSERHMTLFEAACRAVQATPQFVTDAHLAALAIEYDCELASCDNDFGRFPGLRWINPLSG